MNLLSPGSPAHPAEIKPVGLFHLFSRHAKWRVTHMAQLVGKGSRQTVRRVTSRRFRPPEPRKPFPYRVHTDSSGEFGEEARERVAEGVWLFQV